MAKKPNKAKLKTIELCLMAYRYAYYIECRPIIVDRHYDLLEGGVRQWLPEDSPIQRVGSDLESSYTPEIRELARKLRTGEHPPPQL